MAVVLKHESRQRPNPERPLRGIEVIQGAGAGLLIVAFVTVTLLTYRSGALAALIGPTPPDVIILVVVDALRADRLPIYGYTAGRTPHISALAHDGVLYQDVTVQATWTKPSVATILTSLYPSTHRALTEEDILPDAVVTLPEILAAHGYHTAGFVANTNLFPELNFQQGFAEYYALDPVESAFLYEGDGVYQEAERVNWRVLPWLAEHRDQRFFLYLHYMDPHSPYFEHSYNGCTYQSEDPALAQLQSAVYDGEITYLDAHFGRLTATLKQLGLYDPALIVFTADHGEEFYEHQGWAHGKALYQETVRVPLIIKYPGGAGAGTVDAGLVRGLDIAPTVLDVAGLARPAEMQGVSLRGPARAPFAVVEDLLRAGVMGVRAGQYKLIEVTDGETRGRGTTQLYDLVADPGETTNLASTRPDLVATLRGQLSTTIALAERAAVTGGQVELSAAFRERLRKLGY